MARFERTAGYDHYNTPPFALSLVRRCTDSGHIDLDPCSNRTSLVRATTAWDKKDDGLVRPWRGFGTVFVNPPYGTAIATWVAKIALEFAVRRAQGDDQVMALLPARPGTQWFDVAWTFDALCFWHGRLAFLKRGQRTTSAMFPSVFAYCGARPDRFAAVFEPYGQIVRRGRHGESVAAGVRARPRRCNDESLVSCRDAGADRPSLRHGRVISQP